ncbi:MAG: TonB-dependent receptor [Aquisalinus sp.]|nr:TonB-dependent receptor [Aquisalinus sp.]
MKKINWLKSSSMAAVAVALAVPATGFTAASAQDDEIIVTGSFIKRQSQADLPSPIQTVGSEQIDAVGAKNIADITQTLTINTGAQNSPDAFTQNSTTGTSSINLRGLGLSSTLVLLNGKRQVLTATTTNDGLQFVDTSSLVPLIAVDRLEILKDGASATYGSDAVAGVANFITYDSYEGVRLNGQYQTTTGTGDSDEYLLQGLFGKNLERGNIMAAISYLERTPLTTADKRLSRAEDDTSVLGNPGAYFLLDPPLASSFPGLPIIDPTGCEEVGGDRQVLAANAGGSGLDVGFCGFDFGDFFNLIAEEERLTGYVQADFELTDTINLRLEGTYADNTAVRGNSPTFPFLQTAVVPVSHPNNPFAAFNTRAAFLGRAIGNGGSVSPNEVTSETIRLSGTVDGSYGDSGSWEISYTYGKNDYVVATEDTVTNRFQCALNGFAFNASTGAACDADTLQTSADGSTVPVGQFYNPFSTSFSSAPNSQAVLDFIIGTQVRTLESELQVLEGVITQDLWETDNGPVGVALGAQYREQTLSADFDAISQNDNFGFIIGEQPYSGDQEVYALFGELGIPLSPIADLQLAVRYEDYGGSIGETVDPKIALLLRPTDTLSLRGSYSTSFRAPSVFQQQGQGTSLNEVNDPEGGTAFAAVRSVGDPDLNPEESEAFNFGASWEPTPGLTIDVDYFSFEFSDVIIPENFQALANANSFDTRYDPNDPSVLLAGSETCERANTVVCRAGRGDTGAITQINANYVNASSVETSGIDFKVEKQIETDRSGTFVPFIEGTYILEYDLEDPQAGSVDGAGSRNFTNFGTSTPELRFNAGLGWQNGAHSANIFARYIDEYSDDQNCADGSEPDDAFGTPNNCPVGVPVGNPVDSHTTLDWQYNLRVSDYLDTDKSISFTLGMINALDSDPPQVFTNGGFDSKVHDPRGQLTYIGLDLEF